MIQEYFCEECKHIGSVKMPDHIDLMGGIYAIRDDHAAKKPKCHADPLTKIRVRTPGFDEEWNRLVALHD